MPKRLIRQVFEIRYTPLVNFFDNRSALLERLFEDQKKKNFEHWQLRETRVDLFDADATRRFFVSFSNCGFQCDNPASATYAKEQILKYVGECSDVLGSHFEEVARIGFREIGVFPTESLGDTQKTLADSLIRTESPFIQNLNSKLTDHQLTLVFKRGEHKYQVVSGATTKDNLNVLLGVDSDWPDASVYLDVDYFCEQPTIKHGLRTNVSDFLNKAQDTIGTIRQQLVEMKLPCL